MTKNQEKTLKTPSILHDSILLESIKGDKVETLSTVKFKLIDFDTYSKITVESGEDEEKKTDLLISAITSLSENEIAQLKTPDFNELETKSIDQITQRTSYFYEEQGLAFDDKQPTLLKAIDDLTSISMKMPTIKQSRTLNSDDLKPTLEQPFRNSIWICQVCTGLTPEQISQLSIVDWNETQETISDFLNQASDFFR